MLIIIKWFSKRNGLQGWLYCCFFNPPEKTLPAEKLHTDEWDYYSLQKHIIKETGPKVGYFAGFCHHHLTTMSAHTHAYRYPLVESTTKTGLRAIALCRKDRVLLSKHKKQQ